MSAIKKINSTKESVIRYLVNDSRLRDSDEALCCRFWFDELENKNINARGISAYTFFEMYAKGKLTSSMSIERQRRKIQENNIELRGKKWASRQKEEVEVRQEINNYKPESFPNL